MTAYLATLGDTYAGKFNTTGRAYPDVSTQAQNFIVNVAGTFYLLDGTSCSSPTFASVIALVNDRRIQEGKPALGFLNPLIYSSPGIFNDILTGSNPGCGTDGFPAAAGWDPVRGSFVERGRSCTHERSVFCLEGHWTGNARLYQALVVALKLHPTIHKSAP